MCWSSQAWAILAHPELANVPMTRLRMAAKLAYRFWHSTGLASDQQTVEN